MRIQRFAALSALVRVARRLSNCGDSTGRATALPYRNGTSYLFATIDSLNLVWSGVTVQATFDLPGSRNLRFDLSVLLWLNCDSNLRQTQKPKEPDQTGLKHDQVDTSRQRCSKVKAD
jgi:hypothetical protein